MPVNFSDSVEIMVKIRKANALVIVPFSWVCTLDETE